MRRVLFGGTAATPVLFLMVILALAFGQLGVQTAKADNLYARIQGVVLDPSGASLAGVQLTATNLGTNIN